MKTFEEAFHAATSGLPKNISNAQILDAVEDYTDRFKELSQQVQHSREFQGLLWIALTKVATDEVGIEAAFFAFFMQGLATGIEMEKAE